MANAATEPAFIVMGDVAWRTFKIRWHVLTNPRNTAATSWGASEVLLSGN